MLTSNVLESEEEAEEGRKKTSLHKFGELS